MNLRHSYAVFLRYMTLLFGSPQRLFQIFIWGALDVVLWGFLTKYLTEIGGAGFGIVPTLLGAVILLDFAARAHQGTSTPALEDIWSNNLLNYFASPLSVGEYVVGLVGSSIVTSTFSAIVMVAIAYLVFGFSFAAVGPSLLLFLITLFFFGISLGVFGASIVLRFGPSGEWWVWPMTALLSPLMGVFYPISVLPQWMQFFSALLPPTYVFEGLRAILLQGSTDSRGLIIGLILSVVYILVAQFVFVRVYRAVVRNGLLARYSAESL
ncbi:MAG: ABC transporter permease [Candidatus Kaiserbacteria bacterium]|nr:MAG: ABC transporter permease [Candidatus Kaiserbacteria bacterium]